MNESQVRLSRINNIDNVVNIIIILFIIGLWFLNNPYKGIYHDGIIYLGQALSHTPSGGFLAKDPFFSFGSQDKYSYFSFIYVQFINLLGSNWGAISLLIFCVTSFYIFTFLLLREFIHNNKYIWFGICCLIVFSRSYGGNHIFSFSETFLTARSFSEPICILSLYLLVNKNFLMALILASVAFIFHPIMALPVIVIIWLVSSLNNPQWLWLAGCSLIVVLLAFFDVKPFNDLFKTYDPNWYFVAGQFKYAFPLMWNNKDWIIVFFDILVLVILFQYYHDIRRHIILSVLLVGIGGILLSVIFADILKNVLLTGLQLWRSHWIMHYFALALTPVAFFYCNQGSDGKKIAAWSLPIVLLASEYVADYFFLFFIAMIIYFDNKYTIIISNKTKIILIATYIIVAIIIALADFSSISNTLNIINDISISLAIENVIAFLSISLPKKLLSITLVNLLIAVLVIWLLLEKKFKYVLILIPITLSMLFMGIYWWDQRQSWTKFIETSYEKNHVFSKHIPIDKQVYWQQSIVPTWLLLQRPSYYSKFQFAGSLFNRDTSLEYIKRTINMNPLEEEARACIQTSLVDLLNFSKSTENCQIKQTTLKDVCLNSVNLYAVILELPVKDTHYIDKWTFKTENGYEINFFLYLCDSYQ